jgi:hypothetical protein
MRTVFTYTARTLLLIAFIGSVFIWFEAEKEIRILCGMFSEGQESEYVIKTLDTGNFLKYRWGPAGDQKELMVYSAYNLWSSHCTVRFTEGTLVASSRYLYYFNLEKTAGWLGGLACLCMALFQLLLAPGILPGRLAQGGESKTSSTGSRISGLLSVLILLFAVVVLFESAGIYSLLGNETVAGYAVPILAILFGISSLYNPLPPGPAGKKAISRFSLLLFCLFLIVALAG